MLISICRHQLQLLRCTLKYVALTSPTSGPLDGQCFTGRKIGTLHRKSCGAQLVRISNLNAKQLGIVNVHYGRAIVERLNEFVQRIPTIAPQKWITCAKNLKLDVATIVTELIPSCQDCLHWPWIEDLDISEQTHQHALGVHLVLRVSIINRTCFATLWSGGTCIIVLPSVGFDQTFLGQQFNTPAFSGKMLPCHDYLGSVGA